MVGAPVGERRTPLPPPHGELLSLQGDDRLAVEAVGIGAGIGRERERGAGAGNPLGELGPLG